MMKKSFLLVVLFLFVLYIGNSEAAEMRTFTGSNGKKIEAELISFDSDTETVKIRLKNGKEQTVKIDLFSKADQDFVRSQGNGDNPFGETVEAASEEGFEPIFDGKTLSGWTGDRKTWSVQDGTIVGVVRRNSELRFSYLVYEKEEFEDFILRFDIKTSPIFNSGIQVRSWTYPDKPFMMHGYQFEYHSKTPGPDATPQTTGAIWSQAPSRMKFFAEVGQVTEIRQDHAPFVVRELGNVDQLLRTYKKGQWNQCELRVEGYTLTHIINSRTMSICTDKDKEMRRHKGLIGIQISTMPDTNEVKLEFKNIRIKKLSDAE